MFTANRISRFAFVGILLVAAGCQDEVELPTDTQPEPAEQISAAESRTGDGSVRPHEAEFFQIAQSIKGFGGYYFDEEGTLVAYLTDPGEQDRALSILGPLAKKHVLSERQKGSGRVRFETARFNFLELASFRDQATDPVLNVEEVQFTDLDEAQNRFVVGISGDRAKDEVYKVLAELKIPEEAVVYEMVKPVDDLLSLRDYSRPIEGGFQIQNANGGICTLGFNAYWSGKAVFLTNSHCTSSFWKTDYVNIYQNDTAPSSNLIGYEAYDPSAYSCGFLWLWDCRWSDAAVIRKNSSVPWNYAKIARTNSWATGDGNSGSLTVNPSNPRMTITGEYSFPKGGEMFDKMGRTTGWTYGFVKKTCVDVNKSGMRRAVCQDWIHKMHADFGDSGSPIFRWHGNNVTLAGLLWGKTSQDGTNYILMSAMWNIEKDMGGLSTF